jgi:hypothetical protein
MRAVTPGCGPGPWGRAAADHRALARAGRIVGADPGPGIPPGRAAEEGYRQRLTHPQGSGGPAPGGKDTPGAFLVGALGQPGRFRRDAGQRRRSSGLLCGPSREPLAGWQDRFLRGACSFSPTRPAPSPVGPPPSSRRLSLRSRRLRRRTIPSRRLPPAPCSAKWRPRLGLWRVALPHGGPWHPLRENQWVFAPPRSACSIGAVLRRPAARAPEP